MFRKFSCFACRSEAEADGNAGRDYRLAGDNQKSKSGFSSKKVRISSKRHRQFCKPSEGPPVSMRQGSPESFRKDSEQVGMTKRGRVPDARSLSRLVRSLRE